MTVSVRRARPSLKYCLMPRGFVVAAQRRIDSLGQDSGAKRPGVRAIDRSIEDQRNLIGAPNIEVISNHTLKPHPARLRPVKHTGVGNLKLAECQIVDVAGSQVCFAQRRGQAAQASARRSSSLLPVLIDRRSSAMRRIRHSDRNPLSSAS